MGKGKRRGVTCDHTRHPAGVGTRLQSLTGLQTLPRQQHQSTTIMVIGFIVWTATGGGVIGHPPLPHGCVSYRVQLSDAIHHPLHRLVQFFHHLNFIGFHHVFGTGAHLLVRTTQPFDHQRQKFCIYYNSVG